MSRLSPSTLADLINAGHGLRAYCHETGCNHHVRLDLRALAERLGVDHSIMHHDLVPKLRCSKCGSKDVGIRHSISARD